jgi:hypothetical protein
MDPVSVIGLVGTCMTITVRTTTVVSELHTLKTKYKNLEQSVGLFVVQISALRSAATRLSVWIQDSSDTLSKDEQLDLHHSLAACETLIELLHGYVSKVSKAKFSFVSRTKYLWDESTIRECQSVLGSQVQALGFHLQILQLLVSFHFMHV